MKKLAVLALALLIVAAPIGCYGPQKVTYKWQDITDEFYATSEPWLAGNVITYAVISIVSGVTWWVDGLVNIYYFWVEDAKPFGDGKGTPAVHKNPTRPSGK